MTITELQESALVYIDSLKELFHDDDFSIETLDFAQSDIDNLQETIDNYTRQN